MPEESHAVKSQNHTPIQLLFPQGLDLPSQVHLNGSVGTDDHNIWVAILDASVEGQQRGSLRLTAGARSGLRLEGHLIHNLTALEGIPGQSRIVVTGSGWADSQGYETEVELQLGECAVRGSATVMTRDNLKGAVVYHNNCTALQVPAHFDESILFYSTTNNFDTVSHWVLISPKHRIRISFPSLCRNLNYLVEKCETELRSALRCYLIIHCYVNNY